LVKPGDVRQGVDQRSPKGDSFDLVECYTVW